MKARIDAGTDVAMIGAWDAQRDSMPFTASELKHVSETLDADAAEGHVFLFKDDELTPRSEEDLRTLVGSADLEYYDRINSRGCLGGALTLLLFPILSFPLGWKVALPVTAVVFLSFFPALERLLKRNARYQRLHTVVPVFRLQNQDPMLVAVTVQVADARAEFERLRNGGLPIAYSLHDEPWGQRRFAVCDPSGTWVDIIEPIDPAPGFWEKYLA